MAAPAAELAEGAAVRPEASAWGLALGLVAVVLGLGGSGFWTLRDRGPGPEAVATAAAALRARHAEGDLVLLAPFYATRAREWLGDLHPVAPRDPAAEDFEAHRRVWVLGLFGAAARLRPALERSGLRWLEDASPVAGVGLDLYAVTRPAELAYRFVDHLREARVHYEQPDGKIEPCDVWSDENGHGGAYGRWACRRDAEWFYVSPEWHRMGDHLRLCLWAHPPNGGRLVVRFPDVPLVGRLSGRGGHTLNASVHARERVQLDVQVGSLRPERFAFALEDYWRPFGLETPSVGTATVSFAVSSPDAGANHFCFVADMRRPAP